MQASKHIRFRGILTHAGHSYHCRNREEIIGIAQEHGLVTSKMPIAFENFPVGSFLRIIPNHSCLTAALYDRYHVVDENRVIDEWKPMRGW